VVPPRVAQASTRACLLHRCCHNLSPASCRAVTCQEARLLYCAGGIVGQYFFVGEEYFACSIVSSFHSITTSSTLLYLRRCLQSCSDAIQSTVGILGCYGDTTRGEALALETLLLERST
jgi:hypothetical protein